MWLSRVKAESKRINGCWTDSTWTVGNSTKTSREQSRSRPRTKESRAEGLMEVQNMERRVQGRGLKKRFRKRVRPRGLRGYLKPLQSQKERMPSVEEGRAFWRQNLARLKPFRSYLTKSR